MKVENYWEKYELEILVLAYACICIELIHYFALLACYFTYVCVVCENFLWTRLALRQNNCKLISQRFQNTWTTVQELISKSFNINVTFPSWIMYKKDPLKEV